MASFKPNTLCTHGTLTLQTFFNMLNTITCIVTAILSLHMFGSTHILVSTLYICKTNLILDHLMSYHLDTAKNVSQSLQWRMYCTCNLKILVKLMNMKRTKTADLIMFITMYLFISSVLKTSITCTRRPRNNANR